MIAAMQTAPTGKILIVEDDEEISRLVGGLLSREGFEVKAVPNGEAMTGVLARGQPDLIILDLMLPGEDGLSICRRLRANSQVPILMLTAKSDDIDRVIGLEMGADDYLGKPFHPRELLARVRAILRRAGPNGGGSAGQSRRYTFADFVIDLDARTLTDNAGNAVPLTSAEFDLLACFILRPRRVLSRDQLLDWTRGRMSDPFDRTIDMSISRLRKKLEAVAPEASIITTVRNNGYLFVPSVSPVLP
jgi:DNA-binding response OmpR family regulator